jgi:protein O-mannosyl-transferase
VFWQRAKSEAFVTAIKASRKKGSRAASQPVTTARVKSVDRRWHQHAWRILALWILLLATYSNSFKAGLLFDNDLAILQDGRIHAATSQNVRSILTGGYWVHQPYSGLYRPLTTLSYLLNYAVIGNAANPAGYHWLNLMLHAVNSSLVYALGLVVFAEPLLALPFAAIWGLHPLLTDSVTNVVGRADLLAAFGVLSGLLCHVKAAASTGRRKLAWVMALVGAQMAGLFSKENAAVLPAIMLLYDLTWPGGTTWRKRAFSYAALALPFAAFFSLRLAVHTELHVLFRDNPLVSAGFWTARLTAIKVIGKFLWLFAWPARLSADYSYNAVPLFGWRPTQWEDAKSLLALIFCARALWSAVHWRRTWQAISFFLIFFLIALLPTANLVFLIGSIMAERFIYLPSIGLAGCAVIGVDFAARRLSQWRPIGRRISSIALAILCLAFAARTYARNFDWYDAPRLWTSAVNAYPNDAKAHMNLGNALLSLPGRLSEAIAEYETALRIDPNYAEAHNNLGTALSQLPGRLTDAIAEYEAAVRIDPSYAEAHNNLASAVSQIPERLPEAIAEFEAAVRLDPEYAEAHNNFANALSQIPGRSDDAIREYKTALRIDPAYADAHYNLGTTLAQMPGRLPEAAAELQAAVRIQPENAGAHHNLANVLSRIPGRLPDAIAEWKTALSIEPNLVQAHYNLGMALSQIPGRMPDAIAELETVFRITSDPKILELIDRLRAGK